MNFSKFTVLLDIHKTKSQATIELKKDDSARQIHFILTECGKSYQIAEDCYAIFRAKKPDGTVLYNDCEIAENTISYTLTNQTTAAVGTLDCEITLYSSIDNSQITSPRFSINVDDIVYSDSEVESSNEYSGLVETTQAAQEVVRAYENGELDPIIDQSYNPKSENAQSGIAVEKSLKPIKEAIGCRAAVVDIFEESELLDGYYNKEAGTFRAASSAKSTPIFDVVAGEKFIITSTYGYFACLVACYDETNTYLADKSVFSTESANTQVTDYEFTVPDGVARIGISTRMVTNPYSFKKNEYEVIPISETLTDTISNTVPEIVFETVGDMASSINTELQDIRIGADGRIHETAGNAVREQSIYKITKQGKNLYNPEFDTFGNRADGTGNVNLGLRNSEWIKVEPNTNYVLSNNGDITIMVVIALKNSDDSISVVKTTYNLSSDAPLLITTTETSDYIRFSTYKAEANNLMAEHIMLEEGGVATEYEPYKLYLDYENTLPISMRNLWLGKKMVVDGDSISHDYEHNYWQFVASKILGMTIDTSIPSKDYDATNGVWGCGWRGIGGSTIANEDAINGVTDEDALQKRSIVLRYQNLPDDADIVLIAGGSNDWAHNLVEIGDFDSTDDKTFNGALNILLPALKTKYPNIPIVMMTPIKRGATYNAANLKGYTLQQFADALIAKCRQYNVYCLDMWGTCPISPHIPVMLERFFKPNDTTHPNADGHAIMGKTVAGFIRTLN